MLIPFFVRQWLEGESLAGDLARRRGEGRKGRSVLEALTLLAPAFEAAVDAQAGNELHLALNPLEPLPRRARRASLPRGARFRRGPRDGTSCRPLLPEYAAPEQLDPALGAPGPWSDVYTLADRDAGAALRLGRGHRTAASAGRFPRWPTPRVLGISMPHDLEVALSRAVSLTPDVRQSSVAELWGAVKSAMQPPAAVAGAVPPRRLFVPSSASIGTMPLGFQPGTPKAPTYVPKAQPAEPELPPVHAVTTPLPPRIETPALPPVIVETQTPLPVPALPLPPDLPPRPPPSPTFPVIETRRRGRAGALLASAIVGLAAGAGLAMLGLHLRAARASAVPYSLTAAVASPAAPALAPTLASALGPEQVPSSAQAPAPEQAPAPASSPAAPAAVELPPTDHFLASAGKQALDALSTGVAKCRRGKVWGIATATVHFGNDGAVSHVEISVPFTGTPTGVCVSETLTTARVGAFGGKPGIVLYRFYVAPK